MNFVLQIAYCGSICRANTTVLPAISRLVVLEFGLEFGFIEFRLGL